MVNIDGARAMSAGFTALACGLLTLGNLLDMIPGAGSVTSIVQLVVILVVWVTVGTISSFIVWTSGKFKKMKGFDWGMLWSSPLSGIAYMSIS